MITFSTNSPRWWGEKESLSEWKEIPYKEFRDLSFKERKALVERLTEWGYTVHYRVATRGGRARIFINSQDLRLKAEWVLQDIRDEEYALTLPTSLPTIRAGANR